jgi:hypothetical protein
MAAVLGRSFDLQVLIGVFDQSEQDVDACLEILLARHLVRKAAYPAPLPRFTAPAGDCLPSVSCYEFTHSMLWRVIYACLSPGQQQRLQERMAQARLGRISSIAADQDSAATALHVRPQARTIV